MRDKSCIRRIPEHQADANTTMTNPPLRLWTWQLPNWDLTCERRDPERLCDAWGNELAGELKPLYAKLFQTIGTDNFIWCSPLYEHWAQWEVRRLWVLNVQRSMVLRYICDRTWEKLRHDARSKRESLEDFAPWHSLFLSESVASDIIASDKMQDDLRKRSGVSVLLVLPISAAWVVDRTRFNMGPGVLNPLDIRYEDLPTEESEAKRLRDMPGEAT